MSKIILTLTMIFLGGAMTAQAGTLFKSTRRRQNRYRAVGNGRTGLLLGATGVESEPIDSHPFGQQGDLPTAGYNNC